MQNSMMNDRTEKGLKLAWKSLLYGCRTATRRINLERPRRQDDKPLLAFDEMLPDAAENTSRPVSGISDINEERRTSSSVGRPGDGNPSANQSVARSASNVDGTVWLPPGDQRLAL
jgi:hypothetical protein